LICACFAHSTTTTTLLSLPPHASPAYWVADSTTTATLLSLSPRASRDHRIQFAERLKTLPLSRDFSCLLFDGQPWHGVGLRKFVLLRRRRPKSQNQLCELLRRPVTAPE
jgi:hypothetical protein